VSCFLNGSLTGRQMLGRPRAERPKAASSMSDAKPKTRVLLVDDHPMVRHGLAALVNEESDMMVCGEAGEGSRAMELIATVKPDLAIIDLTLNDRDGIELIKEIHSRHPNVRLLVLSMHDEGTYAERALGAGASGYVTKAEAAGTMMTAIRRVLEGKIYASEAVTDRLLRRFARRDGGISDAISPVDLLSERELQIFLLLGDGIKARAIAAQLFLSVKTVETHRANIRKKLGIANSADLLCYAIQFLRNRI
jgi:DNA-binding NarL/FixJ family response regulator